MNIKKYLILLTLNFVTVYSMVEKASNELMYLPNEIFSQILNLQDNNDHELAKPETYSKLAMISKTHYSLCLEFYKIIINTYVKVILNTFDKDLAEQFAELKYFAECSNFSNTFIEAKNFLNEPILQIINIILNRSSNSKNLALHLHQKIKLLQEKEEGNLIVNYKNFSLLDLSISQGNITVIDFLVKIFRLDITRKNIKLSLILNKGKKEFAIHSIEHYKETLDPQFINLMTSNNLLPLFKDSELIGKLYDNLTCSILAKLVANDVSYNTEKPEALGTRVKQLFMCCKPENAKLIKDNLDAIFEYVIKNNIKIKLPQLKAAHIKEVFSALDQKYKDNLEKAAS